jgi:hypothetical protein
MLLFLVFGSAVIVCVWAFGDKRWAGLLTALIGLVGSGGIVWAVRLIGRAALRREAMGFGDVTLMMMIGTVLGWQACLIAFFLAPFAGLLIGIAQLILRRDDEIPYGPFLCLGSCAVVVWWANIWIKVQPYFAVTVLQAIPPGIAVNPRWAPLLNMMPLVPVVVVACLALLGIMLWVWRLIKTAVFGVKNFDE